MVVLRVYVNVQPSNRRMMRNIRHLRPEDDLPSSAVLLLVYIGLIRVSRVQNGDISSPRSGMGSINMS